MAAASRLWLCTENRSMDSRSRPNRWAIFSVVCPMENPQTGSVSPWSRPMTGLKCEGFSIFSDRTLSAMDFERVQLPSQVTNSVENNTGAWLMDSVPPARTRSDRPRAILVAALSSACRPLAQFLATVHAGVDSPHPMRNDATRPMFASSAVGATQPRITSSRSVAANGCRFNSGSPAATARSTARKGPGFPVALRNGVRAPSMIYTGRPVCIVPVVAYHFTLRMDVIRG